MAILAVPDTAFAAAYTVVVLLDCSIVNERAIPPGTRNPNVLLPAEGATMLAFAAFATIVTHTALDDGLEMKYWLAGVCEIFGLEAPPERI